MDKNSSMEQKTWQVYSFGKRTVFRLHLDESREGFCSRGRSFHADGQKTCLPLVRKQRRKAAALLAANGTLKPPQNNDQPNIQIISCNIYVSKLNSNLLNMEQTSKDFKTTVSIKRNVLTNQSIPKIKNGMKTKQPKRCKETVSVYAHTHAHAHTHIRMHAHR